MRANSSRLISSATMLVSAMVYLLTSGSQASAQSRPQAPRSRAAVGHALGPFEFNGDLRSLPKAEPSAISNQESLRPGLPSGLKRGCVAPFRFG
jgi:hypothetical protein